MAEAKLTIEIPNWKSLQWDTKRDPIWIKLYRKLRHNKAWRGLSTAAAKLYIDLLMLASEEEPHGKIVMTLDDLAWELRAEAETIFPLLDELAEINFVVTMSYQDVTEVLTIGEQPGPLTRRGEETEDRRGEKKDIIEPEPKKETTGKKRHAPEIDVILVRNGLKWGDNQHPPKRGYQRIERIEFEDVMWAFDEKIPFPENLVIETQEELDAFFAL